MLPPISSSANTQKRAMQRYISEMRHEPWNARHAASAFSLRSSIAWSTEWRRPGFATLIFLPRTLTLTVQIVCYQGQPHGEAWLLTVSQPKDGCSFCHHLIDCQCERLIDYLCPGHTAMDCYYRVTLIICSAGLGTAITPGERFVHKYCDSPSCG